MKTINLNPDDSADYDALLQMIGKAVTERHEGIIYLADYRPAPTPQQRMDSLLRDYFKGK